MKDPSTQECLDAIARQFPIQPGQIASKAIVDKQLSKPVIAGAVKANGEKELGEGFSSEKTAAGLYKLTLTVELPTTGICVCSTVGAVQFARTQSVGKKVFEIATEKTSTLVLEDAPFHFMIKAT